MGCRVTPIATRNKRVKTAKTKARFGALVEIIDDSVDNILMQLYQELPKHPVKTAGSRAPIVAEIVGASMCLKNPRARISRSESRGKPFSALGELLWYLSGSDRLDFIKEYIREYQKDAVDGILEGAYGPRLFKKNGKIDQLANVIRLLQSKPDSKRAVIQLFDASDIASDKKEVPCTTTLQFLLREGRLSLLVTMRSNDAFYGLPHDIFCFTMLQELVASTLSVELGVYHHFASSLHVYEGFMCELAAYVEEGYQKAIPMPAMPLGDPRPAINQLLELEARLRRGEDFAASAEVSSPYWADLARLLQVHWRPSQRASLRTEFADPVYRPFVDGRLQLQSRA